MRRRSRKLTFRIAVGAGVAALAGGIWFGALTVTSTPSPPPVDPNIEAKAKAFSEKVQSEKAKADAEYLDSLLVKITKPSDRPLRVLFSGDSLADAWYATTPEKGFVRLIAAGIQAKAPVEVSETHRSGYRVQDLAVRFPVPAGIDLAVVELGTNDMAKKTDPALFRQQYGAYLDSIRAKSAGAQFLCLGVWSTPSPEGTALDTAITEECAARGGKFLKMSTIYANGISRGPVGISTFAGPSDITHPNDTGHGEIARQALDRIIIN